MAFAFLETAKRFGYPLLDVNGANQNGFFIPQSTLRRGARCSTAKAYLTSIRERENLHVVTFAYVTRILFNKNKEAIGVIFDRFGERHSVFASREIILSAGSINSPQLLMLSGWISLSQVHLRVLGEKLFSFPLSPSRNWTKGRLGASSDSRPL